MFKNAKRDSRALSANTVKKENSEAESTRAQASANANVEVKQAEAQEKKKGKHGEDFCCGSCS